jgi:hypothetical protein
VTDRARVRIVASQLGIGEAETQLLKHVRRIDASRYDVTVCSLVAGGALVPKFRRLGVTVRALADAALSYLADPSLAAAHGSGAREIAAERCDLGRTVREYESAYAELIGRNGLGGTH